MPNDVAHFAVTADDVERARTFYERAFGWSFETFGPPDFYNVQTSGDDAIVGALELRGEHTGPMRGFICTIAVEDVAAAAEAVCAAGGQIVLEPFEIPGVGTLIQFRDSEDNLVGAMQYLQRHGQ